jgi:cell division protein FtsX
MSNGFINVFIALAALTIFVRIWSAASSTMSQAEFRQHNQITHKNKTQNSKKADATSKLMTITTTENIPMWLTG